MALTLAEGVVGRPRVIFRTADDIPGGRVEGRGPESALALDGERLELGQLSVARWLLSERGVAVAVDVTIDPQLSQTRQVVTD